MIEDVIQSKVKKDYNNMTEVKKKQLKGGQPSCLTLQC